MPFVSFAQNFEDVMLHRALTDVEDGFWIDVGAWHPTRDSVTRAFSDAGWRGVNVEPDPAAFALLATARPRDVNLNCALGARPGEATLRRFADTGLHTLDPAIAARHVEAGLVVEGLRVRVATLAEICRAHAPRDIHFLKIDVEGAEQAVLAGGDFTVHRPWIVLAEATRPCTGEEDWTTWDPLLTSNGYMFVWFDGLNRFYLAVEREAALAPAFRAPPNVFDGFRRASEVVAEDARDAAQAAAELLRDELAAARAATEAARIQAEALTADLAAARALADHRATEVAAAVAELAASRDREAVTAAVADMGRREAAALAAQRDALLASRSWRLTAPMRWVGIRLRRFRAAAPPPLLSAGIAVAETVFDAGGVRRGAGDGRLKHHVRRLSEPFLSRLTERVARRLVDRVPAPPPAAAPRDPSLDTAVTWGLKLYGSWLARELYAAQVQPLVDAAPTAPQPVPLRSKLCEEADCESPWFVHWCRALQITPIYHRKVWEDCFTLQAIWEAGLMREGTAGLCFGAGEEPLPSLLAAAGVDVLATDLAPENAAAAGWIATSQHASHDALFKPHLVDRATFDRRVSFRHIDMNAIPTDLEGRFDLCWSLCSLEHVGSTELACRFMERSIDCLKPGGLAIHTTEYNLSSESDTVTSGWCVLFTRPQIEAVVEKLRAAGHTVEPVSFATGSRPLDQFIDLPPFPHPTLRWLSPNALPLPAAPHLRLALLGHVTTSIALIVRKRS